MELTRSSEGHFEGTVEAGPGSTVAFYGTLELLKVLQDATDDTETRGDDNDS
jgi:hypothetical protein